MVRGFKSFADRTVLDFAPGVSVIVGPNGSGKSNLVDAIAWVLGEQGPKTLRGGAMGDVIFAGTPGRPASGRAEVALTIDNSSGILPIEFTEVTVSRTLFRSGESEYAINGIPCRLLDVQELLSDTGIGRELHTVVGQGQLDEILNGRPEERRAYVEEAAGILKHRRRKERAVRKLERVDADMERLGDVIGELRRQIRPLERQAELAKRAEEIEAELKGARLAVWVSDYLAVAGEVDVDSERRLAGEIEALAGEAAGLGARIEEVEEARDRAARGAQDALGAEYRLGSLRERFLGLARLAEERAGHLRDLAASAPEGDAPAPAAIEEAAKELATASAEREAAEREARTVEGEWAAAAGAREEATRAREEVVHLHGERAALRLAVEAADEERRRIADRREALADRREARGREIGEVKEEIRRLDERETELGRRLEEAEAGRRAREDGASGHEEVVRTLERRVESLRLRRGVLRDTLAREAQATGALLAERDRFPGLLGRIRDLVGAQPGFERAVSAAIEPYAGALVAASIQDAVAAVEALKRGSGRAAFLVGGPRGGRPVPSGVRSVLDVAVLGGQGAERIRAILETVALAGTFAEAVRLAREHEGLVVVTPDGDRVAVDLVVGGAPAQPEPDLAAERDEAEEWLAAAEEELERAREEAGRARGSAEALRREVAALTRGMDDLDALITGAAERLARLEREEHAAEREDAVLAGRMTEVDERYASDSERLGSVEARLGRAVAVERAMDAGAPGATERRAAERALRLGALREREHACRARLEELRARARRAPEEQRAWEHGRELRVEAAGRAAAIARAARVVETHLEGWTAEARSDREAREGERARLEEQLGSARRTRREAEGRLEELREAAHRADLARAERSHRISALVERLRAEHDLAPEDAIAAVGEPARGEALEELRRRASALERRLSLLGRPNPIAMEQYQGLVDRHAFLTEQSEDLKKSRRDLVAVVNEVDRKVEEIFAEAFADVAREFSEVFLRLFPGGDGRLALADPDDLLSSGIEIEARPGGKRVKRISLLSGGERALTAIALLASIFRARPSPFYLLDEVEAALDDVNLHRFLELAKEFKGASQILLVTHQKRTMEIADALYGISMGADGVSRVISERLDDRETVGA